MTAPGSASILDWLYANAGPILRWRMVRDLDYPLPQGEGQALFAQVLASDEVQRWLANLGGREVHCSKDTCAENAMAKLVAYGLRAGEPALDAKMLPYAAQVGLYDPDWVSMITVPFLVAAGYADHPRVRAWFLERLEVLYRTALRRDYELYGPPELAAKVPKAWRGKPIYKPEYHNGPYRLPSCHELYAMAHWLIGSDEERTKIDEVIAYISDPRFQETPGGYLWDRERNTCYAAGRAVLACLHPARLVLFMTLVARYPVVRKHHWFQEALGDLESYCTERGTYILPATHLQESRDGYYLYAGAHMGLGENRRGRSWREIESTFRMLCIQSLMNRS